MSRSSISLLSALLLAALNPACAQEVDEGDELTGEAAMAITQVPTSTQCIRITISQGSQSIVRDFAVGAGQASAQLSLGRLPLGTNIGFAGSAYDAACASITASTEQSWVADPVYAEVQPGYVTQVNLTFRKNNPVSASANFVDNVVKVVAGSRTTYALMADGTVKFWGNLPFPPYSSLTPEPLPGVADAIEIGAGSDHACARLKNGKVKCWGYNYSGAIGDPTVVEWSSAPPTDVAPLSNITQLAIAGSTSCAIDASSMMWCWGNNSSAQFDSTYTSRFQPVLLSGTPKAWAGTHHICTTTLGGGTVLCRGANWFGQLGDGTTNTYPFGIYIRDLSGIKEMALGSAHSCALRADRTVWCWGSNGAGQLGDGTKLNSLTPKKLSLPPVEQLVAGGSHTCALSQGTVYCWGAGSGGATGNGTGQDTLWPNPVAGLPSIKAISSSSETVCADAGAGKIYCWGLNSHGQLGDGTRVTQFTPVAVQMR